LLIKTRPTLAAEARGEVRKLHPYSNAELIGKPHPQAFQHSPALTPPALTPPALTPPALWAQPGSHRPK